MQAAGLCFHSSLLFSIRLCKGLPSGREAAHAVFSCALILSALSGESQTNGG